MFLILLSWLYVFITCLSLGIAFDQIAQLNTHNKIIQLILGLFSVTILASIWAIFSRINIEFHIALLLLNFFLFFKYKNQIKSYFNQTVSSFNHLKPFYKVYHVLISFLILAQCATRPFIIDNETYYIQTIKWLNEYGFVKGLANLHIFFGQTSGWHITQSVFNLSFVYNNFNDLNGFCLLLGNAFAIQQFNLFVTNANKPHLFLAFLPIVNVLFFQFTSAPSPDLPVYIFSFIVFYLFIININTIDYQKFTLISLLVFYIIYIKPTAFLLLLIPLILFFQNIKTIAKQSFSVLCFGLLILGLLITKNILLTGHPLFPFTFLDASKYYFAVPNELTEFYFNQKRMYRFMLTLKEFEELSFWDKLSKWISFKNISGIFNALSIFFVVILPYFIKKYFNQKAYWYLYFIFIIQLVILVITSPQFRFFIHFNLFFSFILLSVFIKEEKTIKLLYSLSLISVIVFLFVPINYKLLTQNKLLSRNSNFLFSELVYPHSNSKMNKTFLKIKTGNLIYHSPHPETFFWANGNGDLPCVNVKQIEYIKNYFGYIPQQNSTNIKDGFYSKKISSNE